MDKTQYVVIGGGIIGSSIAREIAIRKLGEVIVLEKEAGLGKHASGRNSGVLHSGINQKPGSLKARMCVEGNKKLRRYCREMGVPMKECGTLVVANTPQQERTLYTLLGMGTVAGVEGLSILSREELREREPCAEGTLALFSPNGAVVDSNALLNSVASEAMIHGVIYTLGCEVEEIKDGTLVSTKGVFHPKHIINCAGLYADRFAHMMGVGLDYRIIPFRGEYMQVEGVDIRSMVYQVPDLRFPFLGVHLTREVDGKVLAGPTAALSLGRESYDKQIDVRETLEMMTSMNFLRLIMSRTMLRLAYENMKMSLSKRAFVNAIREICPDVRGEDISTYRAGIRAQMVDRKGSMIEDILVEFREDSTHVLNAVSPGITCSMVFAEYVVDRMNKA